MWQADPYVNILNLTSESRESEIHIPPNQTPYMYNTVEVVKSLSGAHPKREAHLTMQCARECRAEHRCRQGQQEGRQGQQGRQDPWNVLPGHFVTLPQRVDSGEVEMLLQHPLHRVCDRRPARMRASRIIFDDCDVGVVSAVVAGCHRGRLSHDRERASKP